MPDHDFVKNPELRNNQLADLEHQSPHKQIFEDFTAKVIKVSDGDTITLRVPFRDFDFPLRFVEMQSKEIGEGGEEAKEWLTEKILNEEVEILLDEERVEKWGRLLGRVIHKGIDIGEEEIMMGLAVTWDQRHDGEILDEIDRMDKPWL